MNRDWLTRKFASDERIAGIAFGARADGIVVDDHASRLDATRAGTGIPALLISAGFALPTVRAEGAFGSAEGW